MKNVESSMDWMSFSNKMKQVACRLSSSACPMVLVLPDGREIRFTDINVDTFDYKGKRGDTEYTSIGFKVNLLGAEVTDVQDDGSLANSPFGNGAKMREALKAVLCNWEEDGFGFIKESTIEAVKQALAAPSRNCDRFDTGDVDKDADDAMRSMLEEIEDDGNFGFRGIASYLLSPSQKKGDEE